MMNATNNPDRSLDMNLTASMQSCLRALRSLERGGIFAHETIAVKTLPIKHELVEFQVTLRIRRGKSSNRTTLRGILHHNDRYNTTRVVASVPEKNTPTEMAFIGALFVMFIIAMMIFLSEFAGFVVLLMMVFPLMVWSMQRIDKYDTQHLLGMVAQALLLAERKSQYVEESPFVEDYPKAKNSGWAS